MKKQLLVAEDGERTVVDALQHLFRPLRQQWEIRSAHSGGRALEIMSTQQIDVIVTDMHLPDMSGVQLLAEVLTLHPYTTRIILADPSDQNLIVSAADVTHQSLPKPCDILTLRATILRAVELRALLTEENLKNLISQMGALPSLPALYYEVVRETRSPDASVHSVGRIIAQDPGMTAKVLQLANSAFFGLPRTVSSPIEAVSYVGLDRIQQLVMSVHAFSRFECATSRYFSIDALWKHSIATALQAKRIAETEQADKRLVEECFTAGLLHDIGKLMLASRLPLRYGDVLMWAQIKRIPAWEAEREILCATHAAIGAYLLGLWGLPDGVVEAIAYHHTPTDCPGDGFSALTALHVADIMESDTEGEYPEIPKPEINLEYLSALGLQERAVSWQVNSEEIPRQLRS
jgi:putative nucleotidyltransferase with HDIG domain